jgi:transcriptional regulator with XRE-family HTH domain
MTGFNAAAGEVLRRVRRSRGMTVREVERRSGEVFKASVLSGYERGERAISLRRFWELAQFYGVPPDRLLADVARVLEPLGRTEVVIDLTRLPLVDEGTRQILGEFARQVRTRRRDYMSDVITLRSGDVEAMSYTMRTSAKTLIDRLAPALARKTSEDSELEENPAAPH